MSKTFSYVLFVIGVYLLIIFPKKFTSSEEEKEEKTENKADTENALGLNENADENGVSQGASGRLKYQMGYTK